MMKKVLMSTAYCGPVAYYSCALQHSNVIVEQYEYFTKQSFRNRFEIMGANGKLSLSIPLRERKNKSLTKEIIIDYKTNWQIQHWRSIESAYSNSPFYEFYCDALQVPFFNKIDSLIEYNQQLQEVILNEIGLSIPVEFSQSYELSDEYSLDARNSFHPKIRSEQKFPAYIQVFDQKFGFMSNLSILDLLFNLGNETEYYLKSIG